MTRYRSPTHNGGMSVPTIRASATLPMGVILLAGLLSGVSVWAQDGLYAPSIPEDAALVRVVNLRGDGPSPRLDIGPVRFDPLPARGASPYRSVPPGVYMVGGRAAGVMMTPAPATFVTVVMLPQGRIELMTDEPHQDPARSQLVLYNFADESVDLVSRRPATEIFDTVPPGTVRAIAVNAIEVELAATVADREVFREVLQMERGESYGIFVTDDGAVLHTAAVSSQ